MRTFRLAVNFFLRAGVTTANKIRVRDRIVALILLVLLLRIETTRTWARGQSLAFGFCHFLLRFTLEDLPIVSLAYPPLVGKVVTDKTLDNYKF